MSAGGKRQRANVKVARRKWPKGVLAPPFCEPCGKRRWPSEDTARANADRRTQGGAPPLRIYRCPIGAGFHLTSKNAAQRPSTEGQTSE